MAKQPILRKPRGNVVHFPANFSGRDLGPILAYLHYLVSIEKHREIVLDFSKSKLVLESGMLPMIPILNKYRLSNKIQFGLVMPKSEALKSVFERCNWAHFIDPFHYDYDEETTGTHCPALRYSNAEEHFACVDKTVKIIMNSIEVSRDSLKAIEWSVNEITDNVLNHAGRSAPGYIQATWFRNNRIVEFVVADAGVGIAQSLGEKDQCRALERAIQEGVTRNKTTNQGNGLYGSYRIAAASRGTFNIYSKFATLYLTKDGDVRIRKMPSPYQGTTVRWTMRTDQTEVISKALVFSGQGHTPYDYLDRLSDAGAGNFPVALKKEFPSLGSRDAGEKVHTFLRNIIINEPASCVTIDFSEVNIVSSSFADEVFGRLFVELGPINFMSRVKFVNADAEILRVIDRAIVQRSGMKGE